MGDIGLGTRLWRSFGFLSLPIVILTAIALWNAQMLEASRSEVDRRQKVQRLFSDIESLSRTKEALVYGYALAPDRLSESYFKSGMESTTVQLARLLEQAGQLIIDGNIRDLYDEVVKHQGRYVKAVGDGILRAKQPDFEEHVFEAVNGEMADIQSAYLMSLQVLSRAQDSRLRQALDASMMAHRLSRWVLGSAAGLALVVGLIMAWRFHRAIASSRQSALALSAPAAQWDSAGPVIVDRLGGGGPLRDAFPTMPLFECAKRQSSALATKAATTVEETASTRRQHAWRQRFGRSPSAAHRVSWKSRA